MYVKVLNKNNLLEGFLTVEQAEFTHSQNESSVIGRQVVKRQESVGILLLDQDTGEFLLAKQFRYAAYSHNPNNGWLLEIVAGYREASETPVDAAIREAEEETGYKLTSVWQLGEFYLSPGYSTEYMYLFFGIIGEKVSNGGGLKSEGENIQIVRFKALNALRSGLLDAKTILAIHLFHLFQQS